MIGRKHLPYFNLIAHCHSVSLSMCRHSAKLSALSMDGIHWSGHHRVLVGPLRCIIDRLRNVSGSRIVHACSVLRGDRHRLRSLCRWGGRRVRWLALARSSLLLSVCPRERATSLIGQIFLVIVDALHVVEEIIPSREAIARSTAFTASVVAQMWSFAVSMHAVCFSFVTKEAGCGREFLLGARFHLAAERLEMRVDELARVT